MPIDKDTINEITLCNNCCDEKTDHLDGKCLFGFTSYEPIPIKYIVKMFLALAKVYRPDDARWYRHQTIRHVYLSERTGMPEMTHIVFRTKRGMPHYSMSFLKSRLFDAD